MKATEQVDRDAAIFAARARGLRWAVVAERHGVSERHAQRVCREFRVKRGSLAALDPLEVVEEVFDGLSAAVEELAELSDSTNHDGTKLGAIRARVEVMSARTNLLMNVGLLPHDLGRIGREMQTDELVDKIVGVFDDHDVPAEVEDALFEALDRPTFGRAPSHAVPPTVPSPHEPKNGHTNGTTKAEA